MPRITVMIRVRVARPGGGFLHTSITLSPILRPLPISTIEDHAVRIKSTTSGDNGSVLSPGSLEAELESIDGGYFGGIKSQITRIANKVSPPP